MIAAPSRRDVVSSFTLIKGSMIDETRAVLRGWDQDASKRDNLDRLRHENFIGSRSATWLRDVAKVLNRRLDPDGRDRALVVFARSEVPRAEWNAILLWHITRDEFLLRDFLVNWLYLEFEGGAFRLHPSEVETYLETITERGGVVEHEWSITTHARVAAGLLKAAVDFGLLKGHQSKEFASYHMPERAFLYVLHAIAETTQSAAKILASAEWRMFLMSADDVEREVLRLHQYRKLTYESAGSFRQLTLPYSTALEYAEAC